MGFQNKFYNASAIAPDSASASGQNEYRINVSSDTPHWYVMDYLTRVSQYYGIRSASVDGKNMLKHLIFTFYMILCNGFDWPITALSKVSVIKPDIKTNSRIANYFVSFFTTNENYSKQNQFLHVMEQLIVVLNELVLFNYLMTFSSSIICLVPELMLLLLLLLF